GSMAISWLTMSEETMRPASINLASRTFSTSARVDRKIQTMAESQTRLVVNTRMIIRRREIEVIPAPPQDDSQCPERFGLHLGRVYYEDDEYELRQHCFRSPPANRKAFPQFGCERGSVQDES